MNVLVGVISPFAAWTMPRRFVDELRREFPQHAIVDAWDPETVNRLLPDADIAFTPHIDARAFARSTRLRWIQVPAAGVGHVLFPGLIESAVVVTSARGVRARAIAEHVLGVTIALARQLPAALRAQAEHRWIQTELEREGTRVRTLAGQHMGIIGLGSIGLEVARLAAAFGFRVSGSRRDHTRPLPDVVSSVLAPDRLLDLLADSDVVVLAAPSTRVTHRLIGAPELDAMKPGALLVNIGRGSLVDDEALIAALRVGRLGGAALDVFTEEPLPASSPYWDLPNVIVTPHACGAMPDYWPRLVALFADNLRRFDAGQPLVNIVDKQAGY